MKLKLNDQVKIVTGKDTGKTGKVTKILNKANRVIVEGYNKYKKHLKKQSDKNPGGIVAIERALDISKVQLVCPSCKKITRVGYQILPTGDKIRICKKCQAQLDTKVTK
jgi:large subunit ribosomal protein L24